MLVLAFAVVALADDVTIDVASGSGADAVVVRNGTAGPVTVSIDLSQRANLRTSAPMPAHIPLEAGASSTVILGPVDPGQAWSYHYQWAWMPGSNRARHDDRVVYQLPYPKGRRFEVLQGFGGDYSHDNEHAVDWAMPVGTPVLAARGGLVIEVDESHRRGGPDRSYIDDANTLRILHDDGTIGVYFHFERDGIDVDVGDRVETGQVIGKSGNTGFTTEPHLHFEVNQALDGWTERTVYVRFRTSEGIVMLMEGGKVGW